MVEYILCYGGPAEHWGPLPATRLASRKILIEQNIKKRTGPSLCVLCGFNHTAVSPRCALYLTLLYLPTVARVHSFFSLFPYAAVTPSPHCLFPLSPNCALPHLYKPPAAKNTEGMSRHFLRKHNDGKISFGQTTCSSTRT
jgi:hypothetical protein